MKHVALSRRTFLKGIGVTMALPFLEAMWPERGFALDGLAIPRRLGFVFFPNGVIMSKWKPASVGPQFELSASLLPLSKVKNKINVLSGLMHDNANDKGDGAGDHARSAATFLTGAHARKHGDIYAGVSADQLASRHAGRETKLPSLELGTEPNRTAGQCDSGYSCAYSSNISWKSPTTPMAKEINPKLAFARMFGGSSEDVKEVSRRNLSRKSILDAVSNQAADLQRRLGKTDRSKLDEYFTSVREIEARIDQAEIRVKNRDVKPIQVPLVVPHDPDEHIKLMFDLLAIAYQTDTTRIATFMLANEGSDRQYRTIGIEEGHHSLSHHQHDRDMMDKIHRIDRYFVSCFASFLEKLDSISEGDGTLLDHSMIVYGCAIGEGNAHSHDDLPIVLAGRGGKTINTGRHITYSSGTPMNNLFLSLLDRMGLHEERFGDSTGRLGQLTG